MHFEISRRDAVQGAIVLLTAYVCQSAYFVTLEMTVVNAISKGVIAIMNGAVCVLMIYQLN